MKNLSFPRRRESQKSGEIAGCRGMTLLSNITWLFLIVFVLFLSPEIHAQELSLSISPPITHIIAKQGKTIVIPYSIVNYGDPTLIRIVPHVISLADSNGTYAMNEYLSDDPNAPRLELDGPAQEPMLLLSKQAYDGAVTITIGEKTPQKDYYFALLAKSEDSKGFETSSSVKLTGGVSSNILLTVSNSGNLDRDIAISKLEIDSGIPLRWGDSTISIIDSGHAINTSVTLSNRGSNMTSVSGRIGLGSDTKNIPQILLLSGQTKNIAIDPLGPKWLGWQKLTARVDIQGAKTVYADKTFVVLPLTILFWFVSIFITLLVGFILYQKVRK